MLTYLRNIFQRFSEINRDATSTDLDSLENNIFQDPIWNQFDQRTNEYESASKRHGETHQRLLNWIGSIDYSGYTREKCLRALIDNYQPGDENRILLRLADWVPQIETLATKWSLENFRCLSIESIRANQNLLLYLSRKRNLDANVAMLEIKQDLLERSHSLTKGEFFLFNSMFRRFLYAWSFVKCGPLRKWMIDDPDPFNRLYLLNSVSFHNLSVDEIKKLKQDSSLFVKRSFFCAQIKAGVVPTENELLALVFDTKQSMRSLGQFYLKKFYQIDAYELYRCKSGEEFYYIADYAHADDLQHFMQGIRVGSRYTAYHCLRALVSTCPDQLTEFDLAELIQKNRKNRSLLLPHLPKLLSLEEIMKFRELIINSSTQGIFSFLQLLEAKSFWAFVDESLSIWIDGTSFHMRMTIKKKISGKLEIHEKLTHERRVRIENKLLQLKNVMPQEQDFFRRLEFMMSP